MKSVILFVLVSILCVACETTNVYPTKTVEVQTQVRNTPTVVTIEKTVTKIDCKSIDPSFEQKGDTCVSMCVTCLKAGGECLDTNNNGYGDTCVTPLPSEPTPVVAPVVECNTDQECSKYNNACMTFVCHQHMCLWTPDPETCNGKDDNCDGQTDEGCPVPTTTVKNTLSIQFPTTAIRSIYFEVTGNKKEIGSNWKAGGNDQKGKLLVADLGNVSEMDKCLYVRFNVEEFDEGGLMTDQFFCSKASKFMCDHEDVILSANVLGSKYENLPIMTWQANGGYDALWILQLGGDSCLP